ncbi:MAG: hypothetical protein ACI9R3_005052 [Verrucomicrobiales bacterium]|jgi:hypothetical protein
MNAEGCGSAAFHLPCPLILEMSQSNHDSDEARYWMQRATGVRRKLNVGWWLDQSAPTFVFGGLLLFAVLFYARSAGATVAPWQGGLLTIAGLLVSGAAAYPFARRRFCSTQQALVRLEAKLRIHNALSTALAGIGKWPKATEYGDTLGKSETAAGMRWQVVRAAGPVCAYMALCAVGLFVPVSANQDDLPVNEPMGWEKMEETLQTLEQEEIVDPEDLEKLRDQIRELRNQPQDEWYSHSSMEATDHLRRNLDASVQNMADDLANAENSLNAASNQFDQLSDSARDKVLSDFESAVQGLDRNGLELNKELMEKLKDLDPSKLNQLDKEQIAELRERLRSAAKT